MNRGAVDEELPRSYFARQLDGSLPNQAEPPFVELAEAGLAPFGTCPLETSPRATLGSRPKSFT